MQSITEKPSSNDDYSTSKEETELFHGILNEDDAQGKAQAVKESADGEPVGRSQPARFDDS